MNFDNILTIFQYDFMLRAFSAGLVIAIIAPLIGQFLVMRRLSLISDTLAHIALASATIGYATGNSPLISSLIGTSFGASLIEWLRRKDKTLNESALALFLFGSLGISAIIASLSSGGIGKIISFLFGSLTTVSQNDVFIIIGLGGVTIIFCLATYKKLFALYYDEDFAEAVGLQRKYLGLLFTIVTAVVICFSLQIVGSLLVGGLMTIPVACATRFARSFKEATLFSVLFSVSAVISGLVTSFALNLPTGGTIVVILVLLYIISFMISRGAKNKNA